MVFTVSMKQHLMDECESIRMLLSEVIPVTNTKESLSSFENQLTINEIEQCFFEATDEEHLITDLKQMLSIRWDRIRNSCMCYTQQPINLVNQLCLTIATIIAPIPNTESDLDALEPKTGPYFLLMPSLTGSCDISSTNIHNFKLHQVVLSDNERVFIPLMGCLNDAVVSDRGDLRHLISEDGTYDFPPLTQSELQRITSHSTPVNNYFQAISAYNGKRVYGAGLGANVQRLIIALRAGGASRAGEEMNAGSPANEGIFAFSQYLQSMPEQQRNSMLNMYPDFKEQINRLMNPTNYRDTRYCVELIANALEQNVANYQIGTGGIPTNLTSAVATEKQNLIQRFARNEYEMLPSAAKAPRVLFQVFQLSSAQQNKIFEHISTNNTRYNNHTLTYAVQHDIDAVFDIIPHLDEQAKTQLIQSRFDTNKTALILASSGAHPQLVRKLLELGANIEDKDNNGSTALQWAASEGQLEVLEILLSHNADIKPRNNGVTRKNVMDYAVNRPALIKPLLLKAITLSIDEQREFLYGLPDSNHQTVLIYAMMQQPSLLGELLEKISNLTPLLKTQINAQNAQGMSLLHLSAKAGLTPIVQVLLTMLASMTTVDNQGKTPLLWAASEKKQAALELLLESGASMSPRNSQGQNVFDVVKDHPELMKPLLLKAITSTIIVQKDLLSRFSNINGQTILMYAMTKHPTLVEELLEKIAQCTDRELKKQILSAKDNLGRSALHVASKAGLTPTVQALLESGADIDAIDGMGNTALLWTVNDRRLHTMEFLLEHGASIAIRNSRSENVFDLAKASPAYIQPLLLKTVTFTLEQQKEFLIRVPNSSGQTVLIYTINQHSNFVEELLKKIEAANNNAVSKMLINEPDFQGKRALHFAAKAGYAFLVRRLLTLGADIEAVDVAEMTPLLYAVQEKQLSVVQCLLESNALMTPRNKAGNNAFDLAKNSSELMKCLLLKAVTYSLEQQKELFKKFQSDKTGHTVLTYVIKKHPQLMTEAMEELSQSNNPTLVKQLLNTRDEQQIPLFVTAMNARMEAGVINGMITLGADISAVNSLSLEFVIENGYSSIAALLLKQETTMSLLRERGSNILHLALKKGNEQIINQLLDTISEHSSLVTSISNARDSSCVGRTLCIGRTPLMTAICSSLKLPIIQRLISFGVQEIDLKDTLGNTALHYALEERNNSIVQILLTLNPAINIPNNRGVTAVNLAITSCPAAIEAILLKAVVLSAEEQQRLQYGSSNSSYYNSALIYTLNHKPELVPRLLETIASNNQLGLIDIKSRDGNTALMHAVKNGRIPLARLLLEHGASILPKNGDDSALVTAIHLGSSLIEPILMKAMRLSLLQQKELFNHTIYGLNTYPDVLTYAVMEKPSLFTPLYQAGINTPGRVHSAQGFIDTIEFDNYFSWINEESKQTKILAATNNELCPSAQAALSLALKLAQAKVALFRSGTLSTEEKRQFKNTCLDAVREAMPALKQHPTWLSWLKALAHDLWHLPTSIARVFTGSSIEFFPMKTDYTKKLDALQEAILRAYPDDGGAPSIGVYSAQ